MTRIILSGCNGKMGRVITRLVSEDENVKIVAGIDVADFGENDYPVFKNPMECNVSADVIVDFSHPSVFSNLMEFAKERKLPIIVATTDETMAMNRVLYSACIIASFSNKAEYHSVVKPPHLERVLL